MRAFLAGSLAEYWDDKGIEIPVWASMNLLAHRTARQIGECLGGANPPGRADRSWRVARSYLAFEVLDLTDQEFTLAELQSPVLIPLDPARTPDGGPPRRAGWTPRRWVHLVEDARRKNLGAFDR